MSLARLVEDVIFGISNLPYGVFSSPGTGPRCGVRFGDAVLDLAAALKDPVFARPSLNEFMAAGPGRWREVREQVTDLLRRGAAGAALHPLDEVRPHLPFAVGDYVDFYASEQHATNAGLILRPGGEPLRPNWRRLPVGYHGRSGTVVVSGTPVRRPLGQRRGQDGPASGGPTSGRTASSDPTSGGPVFGPSAAMDFEAEVGFVIGAGSDGPVPAADFASHVFGVFLVNDWSARDIQSWESAPLGPFLGKSFATSVSPWIVPLDALRAAWTSPPAQDPSPLPYLGEAPGLDIALEVRLNGQPLSRPPFASMYWTPAQMLAHMTVNGATTRPGDFFASGTVSGRPREEWGSLLELSWGGTRRVTLPDGTARTFLEDGDEVTIGASAPGPDGERIGFGGVTGRITPAGDTGYGVWGCAAREMR